MPQGSNGTGEKYKNIQAKIPMGEKFTRGIILEAGI